MVNRTPVALRAIAGQSFPHGHGWLLTLGSIANRLAVALANESDRLAVRRCLFPKGLAILAVTHALDRGRRRLDGTGIGRGRLDWAVHQDSRKREPSMMGWFCEFESCRLTPGAGESRWPWETILLFKRNR